MKTLSSLLIGAFVGFALHYVQAFPQGPPARTLADQPKQQQDAVRKILKLGGDWELGSKTVLVGFIGDKFTNEKFRLLAPLVDLKHLAFFDVPADDRAFTHCKTLENVEWLQITSCKFNGNGLKHFAQCKKLRRVYIEDTPVTDKCLETLAKFKSIEVVIIENWNVPSKITPDGVRKLLALENAKQIYIDLPYLPPDLVREMKARLPNCEIELTELPRIRE